METLTKERYEEALGSIYDAIASYCLVANKNVCSKLEAAQDVINQLIYDYERLKKEHRELSSFVGKDLNAWRNETLRLLQNTGFEDASKYLDAVWEL